MDIYEDGPVWANKIRAGRALEALETFAEQTGQGLGPISSLAIGEDAVHEIAGDLIADLFHLARLNGATPETLISTALAHFEEEVEEEANGLPGG